MRELVDWMVEGPPWHFWASWTWRFCLRVELSPCHCSATLDKPLNLSGLQLPPVWRERASVGLSVLSFPTGRMDSCSRMPTSLRVLSHLLDELIRGPRLASPAPLKVSPVPLLSVGRSVSRPWLCLADWEENNCGQQWREKWAGMLEATSLVSLNGCPLPGCQPVSRHSALFRALFGMCRLAEAWAHGDKRPKSATRMVIWGTLALCPWGFGVLGTSHWWYHGLSYFLEHVGSLSLGSSRCEAPGSLI